ncbi:hypothetical protein C8J57DRAFT_1035221, partial [Mycena rebaudengoi]
APQQYCTALSRLERLDIQRMFELTKMNMLQMGEALSARSQAIQSAPVSYNEAAASLVTPARKHSWSEVVEYAFLADFDLVWNPEELAEIQPWAVPASRKIMDAHFRIKRAHEEILQLNIKIRRVVTKIRDECVFLLAKEAEVRQTDPRFAFMIGLHRKERGCFDEVHMKR